MAKSDRVRLHNLLLEFLGSDQVYYQQPNRQKIEYPCIIYKRSSPNVTRANNKLYSYRQQYDVQLITRDPDSDLQEKFMKLLPLISFDRRFIVDNLYHDNFTITYPS